MQCLDLFAGAGGASVGLTRAGFRVTHVERDPDACATLRAAFPDDEVVEADIREVDWSRWSGKVDLLWSSFPCQAWSIAGSRLGARDEERNGWPWTVAAIDAVRPGWVLCENVPGLLSHVDGDDRCAVKDPFDCPRHYFDEVILRQLRERFAWVDHRVVDAADFGVPQHRNLVFIAAGPGPMDWPKPTHRDPLRPMGVGNPWVTVREALRLRPCDRVIGGGHNPNRAGDVRRYRDVSDEPSLTVTAVRGGNAGPWLAQASETPGERGVAWGVRALRMVNEEGACDALDLFGGREDPDFSGVDVRTFTVEERAVLQAFPLEHPFAGSTTSQHRQVGNAVPPPVAESLGLAVTAAR